MTSIAEWTGRVGDTWATEWPRTDRSFADLATRLDAAVLAAAPNSGTALDVGCGAGLTSMTLAAARPGVTITGIDISPELIAVAQQRAADLPNLTFAVGDASGPARAEESGTIDLVYSRHGVMFFDDPAAAFAALRRRARTGGRLVFSCFRTLGENPWAADLVAALTGNRPSPPAAYAPSPFAFADPDFVGQLLGRAGWEQAAPTPADFIYVAGDGEDPVADALSYFCRIGPAAPIVSAAAPEGRPALIDRLRDALAAHLSDDTVTFPAAAWIWTATAGEPRA